VLGLEDPGPAPTRDPLWPLSTTAAVSWTAQGLSPVVLQALEQRLGTSVAPVSAAGESGAAGTAAGPRLDAGDPVAVLLVDGAARLAATGTVTEVDGDDVLAFGHPLLDAGPVSLPLCRAEIVGLMPSRQISFKFANPGAEVGALLLDRPAGVAGRLGVEADMLPLRVEVEDGLVDARQFEFRVARHPGLSPALSYWCVQNSLALDHDLTAPLTARVEVELILEGEAPLRTEGAVAGLEIGGDLAREVMLPLNLVALQPERDLRVESMRVAVRLQRGRDTATLGRVRMAPVKPRPGEDLRIHAELLPWRGSPRWVELTLVLPDDLPDGRYAVRVSDGAQAFADEIGRAEERWAYPGLRVLREALALRRPPTTLVAVLYGPSRGAVVQGVEWEQLPGSVRAVLGRSRGAAPAGEVKAAPLARAELPLDLVLGGGEILPLQLGEDAPPAPTPTRR
jgi:hypothetical protein